MTQYIDWNDLNIGNKKGGDVKVVCPACSHTRKNKTDRCFSVNMEKGVGHCFHCEAIAIREDIKESIVKEYRLPDQEGWKNKTNLSDGLVKWLEDERNISQRTANHFNATEERKFQPQAGKEMNNLVFNYFEGDTLINKKYRSGGKHFTQEVGSKPMFYNINSIIGKDHAYIVEGEFDVWAMYEINIKNVISLPNGANDNDDVWKNAEKYIKDIKKFYIATDNDEKGNEVAEKIAQRLGRWRCERIVYEGKDANDDLISGCLLKTVSNPKKYPVSGTFTINDLIDGVYDLYDNGLPDTLTPRSTYFGNIPQIFSVMRGHLVVATGIPSHGKSAFVDWYVLNLLNEQGLKASWYTPEHSPMRLYATHLIEKVIGKNFWKDKGNGRITRDDIERYREWAKDKIYLTSPSSDDDPTWDWLIDKFKEQMYSYGIDIFVIDAFNKVILPNGNKLDEINKVLTKLTSFAQTNNVVIFLVAHPTKMRKKEGTQVYEKPTLYDVSGSADFYNQTHDGFRVYRYWDNPDSGDQGHVEFTNLKVKYIFQGSSNEDVKMNYCKKNGRFYAFGCKEPLKSFFDKDYEDDGSMDDLLSSPNPPTPIAPEKAWFDLDDLDNENAPF